MKKYDFEYRSSLHFMVTDETGHTVAIEPHNGLLIVKDNYVHTLTNEPN